MKKKRQIKIKPLIICCGITESNYLKAFISKHQLGIKVIDEGKKAPSTIIKKLIRNHSDKRNSPIYIVCDKDRFSIEKSEKIINEHSAKNIKIILSNPCFELWLLLHLKTCGKNLDTKECQHIWKKTFKKLFGKKYKKNEKQIFKLLEPKLNNAIKNSKKLSTPDSKNTTQTDVFKLIENLTKKGENG